MIVNFNFSPWRDRVSKCIIIEDSHKHILGNYSLKSSVITGRNPWRCDDYINYELDSEEELAEE